jgi:hypothetical protein
MVCAEAHWTEVHIGCGAPVELMGKCLYMTLICSEELVVNAE